MIGSEIINIIGLGNPGKKYTKSRHNAGAMVVSELSARFNIPINIQNVSSIVGKGSIGEMTISLILPKTYMNDSGSAVIEFMDDQAKGNNNLLIVYDDKDLPLGKIRLRPNGSAGGHNGVRSIIDALGTEEFPRLRIGIGSSVGKQDEDVINYVLGRFDTDEEEILASTLVKAGDCIEMYIKSGIEKAMNKFN
ncbi:MAG: aminoacyl-tRNA hydrolase [Dehalococcoidia bacterium]